MSDRSAPLPASTHPGYDDHIDARAALAAAREKAAAHGRRVAVIFGADWCPDSLALDRALAHELVAPIVEPAFEVVRIGVGNRDRHLDLMDAYGMRVEDGIPAVAVLEADGRLVVAQRHGEFRNARSAGVLDIVTFFHRHAPSSAPTSATAAPVTAEPTTAEPVTAEPATEELAAG